MTMSVKGKYAIIPGGGAGINLAFARLLLNEVQAVLNDFPPYNLDKGQPAAMFCKVDVPEHYVILDVNLTAPIRLSQLAIGYWTRNKLPGCIVHLGSIAGYISGPATPLYHASKHGIHGFVMSLGDLRDQLGIRISAIGPAPVLTSLWNSDEARLNTLMKDATFVPMEEVIAAMYELVINEEYGNGTILKVTAGATRVVPKFNAPPPTAGSIGAPNAKLYYDQLFDDLKTKGLQTQTRNDCF
ncbi:hypothetical protein V8C34DRAFT_320288 [Trichoderma compactum]